MDLKDEKITRRERRAMILGIFQAIFPVVLLIGILYFGAFITISLWLSS